MKKVLVVGGAGYVGCVLVEELLAKGYSVRVFDRLFFGRDPARQFLDRVELVVEDMREFDESHVSDCGAVINVGGLSNDPTAEFNPKANEELNTWASIRVAEVARRVGVPKMVFASTCSIYDRGVGEDIHDFLQDEETEVEPKAAYATSKLAAERAILALADDRFTPVAFRKGTIFGFSPRMRYDLVVNAFVKDALSKGKLAVHYGGSMWRPLIDVKDVARAYVMALEADPDLIRGQVFNLIGGNFRISELALRVQRILTDLGVRVELDVDYSYRLVRSYRVSGTKLERALGFQPKVTLEESVEHMAREIDRFGYTDFSHPRYYNIEWMKLLEESVEIVSGHGYVLSKPSVTIEVPDGEFMAGASSGRGHRIG
ncbi:MAG: SDR family oxidoreductase [Actinobacteria bacterium]|nr:MAG: SDR family oxidoreductase [Actinomycetota bacterium]